MRQRINVVVTCTEKKTRDPEPTLMLGSLPAGSVGSRAANWVRRLEEAEGTAVPGRALYTGNHWYVVRTLTTKVQDSALDIRIWVASAGYGLVPIDALLHPYAATFASGSDGVGPIEDARCWWELLAEWEGPASKSPRSLRALAAMDPDAPLLIAASATYVRAMQPDIERAAGELARPGQLAIIAAGLRANGILGDHLLASDERFKRVVGGQMHSLNVRLLRYALKRWEEWAPDVQTLKQLFADKTISLLPLEKPDREPQSDTDVIRFIETSLKQNPKTGHTTLLRRFRESGLACEQKRFKGLFLQVTNASHR